MQAYNELHVALTIIYNNSDLAGGLLLYKRLSLVCSMLTNIRCQVVIVCLCHCNEGNRNIGYCRNNP